MRRTLTHKMLAEGNCTSEQYMLKLYGLLMQQRNVKDAYFMSEIILLALECISKKYGTAHDTIGSSHDDYPEYMNLMNLINLTIHLFENKNPEVTLRQQDHGTFKRCKIIKFVIPHDDSVEILLDRYDCYRIQPDNKLLLYPEYIRIETKDALRIAMKDILE